MCVDMNSIASLCYHRRMREAVEQLDDFQKQLQDFSTLTIEGKDASPESATTIKITEISPPPEKLKGLRRA